MSNAAAVAWGLGTCVTPALIWIAWALLKIEMHLRTIAGVKAHIEGGDKP